MDLICYLHPGWEPGFRPAEPTRDWMDRTAEAFAYRCLPLNIANAHGWEVPSPCSFEAYWTGRPGTGEVIIRLGPGARRETAPVSIFGNGVLTFHVFGLIRTPPGWNLWVGGSPNRWKDGIQPLSGVIETDWSPYTFTMNWRFTRRNRRIRFEKGEPICHFFPVRRGALEAMQPKYVPLAENPELLAQFQAWSRSRDEFQAEVARNPPKTPSDKWQKRYYRGIDMRDRGFAEHQAKLRLKPFRPGHASQPVTARGRAQAPGRGSGQAPPAHGAAQAPPAGRSSHAPVAQAASHAPPAHGTAHAPPADHSSHALPAGSSSHAPLARCPAQVPPPDPGAITLRTDAASLGQALRAVAEGMARGEAAAALEARLAGLGLAPEEAGRVVEALLGVPA